VPDPEKAPAVVELFERYATGLYSDMQIADWLNNQGFRTNRNHPFGKDTVRDMLCSPYYVGKIRYRGMSVRPKGVSYRSTPPRMSEGQNEPVVSEDLWHRYQKARASRRKTVKTIKKTSRINILQGLVVCAYCGRRLRVQTPKNYATYYREDSHLRGYRDCPYSGQSIRAEDIDEQVAELIQLIRLPADWESMVRKLLEAQHDGTDPETERKEIRGVLRLMRENFEHGLYEGEEYIYW
jgi:site-specific DNA recombinase